MPVAGTASTPPEAGVAPVWVAATMPVTWKRWPMGLVAVKLKMDETAVRSRASW